MTDAIKPTNLTLQTEGVPNSQELQKTTVEPAGGDFRYLLQQQQPAAAEFRHELPAVELPQVAQQRETAVADFRHLLQNQASVAPDSASNAMSPPQQNPGHEIPDLALHDSSLKIGRVVFTGNPNSGQDSQLTQFMRDHGFSEGGMAGYMKQTMLGAGSAIAQAVGDAHTDVADAVQAVIQPLAEEAILPPTTPALQAAQVVNQTGDVQSVLSTVVPSKPESLPPADSRVTAPVPLDAQVPMRAEAGMEEALLPASTKDILSAQWPQVQDEQKQTAVAQAAERDSGAADVEFANQQQSGQRSGQGEQSPTFTQTQLANNEEEAQAKAQQYREWSERFSELLGSRLAVAVREGAWSVQLDLDALDLGSVAIQLHAGAEGIEGQVTSSDPAVRQILADSLPKLQAALAEALGDSGDQAVVSLSLGPIQNTAADGFKTIALSADELSKALPADFKAGDGLNVFV